MIRRLVGSPQTDREGHVAATRQVDRKEEASPGQEIVVVLVAVALCSLPSKSHEINVNSGQTTPYTAVDRTSIIPRP